jgi:hypothetical protein
LKSYIRNESGYSIDNFFANNLNQKRWKIAQKHKFSDNNVEIPKLWQQIDPLDEISFSEILKMEFGENAYIVYCIDSYNAYRLTDYQKDKFESFDAPMLANIRANMYLNSDLTAR